MRGALVAPGPSLDDIPDLDDRLRGYDVRVGISEAILHTTELDHLTIFDEKAWRKVKHAVPSRIHVWRDSDFPEPLTQARAGSLGRALGLCKKAGITNLDLYGVDLSVRDRKVKYSARTEENLLEEYRLPENFELHPEGMIVPVEFWVHAQQIEQHKDEWADMEIRNLNPRSALTAFPRIPLP